MTDTRSISGTRSDTTYSAKIAGDSVALEWNEFAEHLSGHHAFDWGWRSILQQSFGHTPYYLEARDSSNKLSGILPLFHVKSFLFGSALISVPYLNGGGILAESSLAERALLEKADDLAKSLNVGYVELRHREIGLANSSWESRSHKVAMILPLPESAEELFQSFPAKLRSQVRRPTKSGVVAERSDSVKDFYAVFAENMRDLGTPVYPRKLFALTVKHFRERARVIIARIDSKPVAAGITIGFGKGVEIPWASSLRSFNNQSPNMLLYWQAIKTACEDHYTSFDFGRSSPDSGTYKFKQQWGAAALPLTWNYSLQRGTLPDVNPMSPKFSLLVNCWRKLPLAIANGVGPWITKSLP